MEVRSSVHNTGRKHSASQDEHHASISQSLVCSDADGGTFTFAWPLKTLFTDTVRTWRDADLAVNT